jgi:hypothetical protein
MAKTRTLAFPVRLPDAMQAGALWLLAASRDATNMIVTALWLTLDMSVGDRTGPAGKQVERLPVQSLVQRSGHGNRQERCELESPPSPGVALDRSHKEARTRAGVKGG